MARLAVVSAALVAVTFAFGAHGAAAQSVGDFYKSAGVKLLITTQAGSGYDLEGRLVARHIGRHIPGNPTIVPQNVPGAGGIRIANTLFNTTTEDGSTLAMLQNTTALMQVTGVEGVQYDASKFYWIGSVSPSVDTMSVWHTTGIKTIDDAKKIEAIAAASGRGGNSSFIPETMNALLGTKFKVIIGYRGGPEVNLALERGEVGARGTSWTSWTTTKADWLKDGKIIVLGYAGPRPKDMPAGVPSLLDLAKSEDDRQIMRVVFSGTEFGRPFAMGPQVLRERTAAMRAAFAATMLDAEFLAEAGKLKIDVEPVTGEHLQSLAAKLAETPKPLAARAKSLVEE